MRRRELKTAICLGALLLLSPPPSAEASCEGCKRRVYLKEVNNVHISDEHQRQRDAFDNCMDANMPYPTLDGDDPAFKAALQKCGSLEPARLERMATGSVLSKLVETLTTECFRLVLKGAPAEYFFRADFDWGLEGEFDHRGKPIISRFTIQLFYDGDNQELVKEWVTESTSSSISSQYTRMFDNDDAALRKDRPLEELLWDFEKRPDSVELQPSTVKAKPGETRTFRLSDFTDDEGRPSREFNRVLVEVEEGEIRNGEKSKYGSSWKVFKVGDGELTVDYRAPELVWNDQNEDTLHVHNSCDIHKQSVVSLYQTNVRDEMADGKIDIELPEGGQALIQGSLVYRKEHSSQSTEYQETETRLEEVKIAVVGELEFVSTQVIAGEIVEYYDLLSPYVASYWASHDDLIQGDALDGCGRWNISRRGSAPQPPQALDDSSVTVYLERNSRRPLRVGFPVFSFELDWTLKYDYSAHAWHSATYSGQPYNCEEKTDSKTYTKRSSLSFGHPWLSGPPPGIPVQQAAGDRMLSGEDKLQSGSLERGLTEHSLKWKLVLERH